MTIRIALNHQTSYQYDREVTLAPQVIRLRPAPHCRTPILSYSLKVEPEPHFVNWQQDPHGNFLARYVFPEKTRSFSMQVDLVADMTVINPFDFFLEESAEKFPFRYDPSLSEELAPFHKVLPLGPRLQEALGKVDRTPRRTVDFLVDINRQVHDLVKYVIRLEPGVQTCEETLTKGSGSCRDSAWLLVQLMRNLGLAARFVSGYLIQLVADEKPLEGPAGPTADFTDLHAWAEVYLPGAGWIGLDPTSGLFAGEGHIPLAATPEPGSAAPITGGVDPCESEFKFAMTVTRIHEDPRVTKPYSDAEWQEIETLGHRIDADLTAGDVRLTMGGEPTFVSVDDQAGAEWNTAALGPTKRLLAGQLVHKLKDRFAPGALLHFGQGKWYPGEPLPRWALNCYWRRDGLPIWSDPALYADERKNYGHGEAEAKRFISVLAETLGLSTEYVISGHEDVWHYLWKERRLPTNVDPYDSKLEKEEDRVRLCRIFEKGLEKIVGFCLPIKRQYPYAGTLNPFRGWVTGPWFFRPERMYLIPGDSPMGLRLPLDSLPWVAPVDRDFAQERDPLEKRSEMPDYARLMKQRHVPGAAMQGGPAGPGGLQWNGQRIMEQELEPALVGAEGEQRGEADELGGAGGGIGGPLGAVARKRGGEALYKGPLLKPLPQRSPADELASSSNGFGGNGQALPANLLERGRSAAWLVRTALCVEPRDGRLHVFMPPVEYLEDYLELIAAIEETARETQLPVTIEGYTPPRDTRLRHIGVTPDPGVIEVNVHPGQNWDELVKITTGLYEDARTTRLGTEKFQLDGRHTGTCGGNHVVLGGATPADSPFLRRPDLLKSLIGYWHNHPSLSYLFSGLFLGPTSQAPRIDEARNDALYEIELAFRELPKNGPCPPWLVDRIFRNLLVDVTGNTHRAEFCIDKLYSPDSSAGRLGLVEFRGFEMPPHARMSLTQQLLLRALVARFWRQPYEAKLARWGTGLHDRWMLPHFIQDDFRDVITELNQFGYALKPEWFAPHYEFRFPLIGRLNRNGLDLEVRLAIEPWHVLGEEATAGGTARYVDSSVERVQIKVQGLVDARHIVTCNGRRIPFVATGTHGEYVAGVRYRAWRPPECLHPTIGIHSPLVFDIVDTWMNRSLGGCVYHVVHPGGRAHDTFPVNAFEAESRRAARFFTMGHTGGPITVPTEECNREFPATLDLRR